MPRLPALRSLRSLPARLLRNLARDDGASLTVEAVVVFPLLIWAFCATFAYYDVYRHKMLAMKGNYAISDLLSRETCDVNMNYLNGTEDVFEYFTRASDADAWIRVTPVRCKKRCDNPNTRVLRRDWSHATDGKSSLTNGKVNNQYRDVVPMIAKGERVIMVESSLDYEPIFGTLIPGIGNRTMVDIVMTRPRFAPKLSWGNAPCDS